MTDTEKPLEELLVTVRELLRDHRKRKGSVHLLVHPDSPIAAAGITSIDRVLVHAEDITFMDVSGEGRPDHHLSPREVHLTAVCPWADDDGRCSEHQDYCDDDADPATFAVTGPSPFEVA